MASCHAAGGRLEGTRMVIQPAVLWLAVAGLLLLATAFRALVAGEVVSATTLDALRHVFAVGVITLAIVGMAQLVLPEFASERLVRPPGGWRGPFFGLVLSSAALLRGFVLLAGIKGDARWQVMAIGGVLGWLALATFATLFWRASTSHHAYLQRISRFREHAVPMLGE